MMNEYQKDKKISELGLELEEKNILIHSELEMNKDLKTQIESLNIHLNMLVQLNRKFAQKLARERVLFKERLDKI
tara:strand:- start:176 stop:400 length:225 start_codon:yes stop_codon:yes gene_type:complete